MIFRSLNPREGVLIIYGWSKPEGGLQSNLSQNEGL